MDKAFPVLTNEITKKMSKEGAKGHSKKIKKAFPGGLFGKKDFWECWIYTGFRLPETVFGKWDLGRWDDCF